LKNKNNILLWLIRILIFVLFTVSGIAKLFPVWAFEKQLVDLGITSWCYAPYLARFMIALELAIGIAILQPHHLKKIVIPGTLLLLLAFCIHLTIVMYRQGAMSGNCGCFGQLIPMTPLEAFIKNIVTIGLLIYLFRNISKREKGKDKFIYLLLIYLAMALAVFVFFPFCPCKTYDPAKQNTYSADTVEQNQTFKDTAAISTQDTTGQKIKTNNSKPAKVSDPLIQNENKGPKKTKSIYSDFKTFGNKTVDLDEGKKVICFFSAGCEDCRETATVLNAISKKIEIPPVYVFFMNEETELIPDFFKEAGVSFPYSILEVPVFWQLLGMNADTPGVVLLWNGNLIRFFEGTGQNKFDARDFETACRSM